MSALSSSSSEQERASLVDDLIATYRELNLRVRPLSESELAADRGGSSIRNLVVELRDDEIAFAQLLKSELTGISVDEALPADVPHTEVESGADSTAMIISQFGTARATTLSLLKSLDDEGWHKAVSNGKTIYQLTSEVAMRDKTYLDKILSGKSDGAGLRSSGSSAAR